MSWGFRMTSKSSLMAHLQGIYIILITIKSSKTSFKIQTAAWMTNNKTSKMAICKYFPMFHQKYCQMSLNLLENICCLTERVRIYSTILTIGRAFDCESIARPLKRFEKEFKRSDPLALLNSKYTQVYNLSISLDAYNVVPRRFKEYMN